MRPLTSKSIFAKNPCKIPMAVLVPFLLFGCSGGKTEKSDAGAKSKDVQVQTTGSEDQRKLAMGATAVPGVSVSAVFGADADKLMAFGLKELGKSGDSLSLAGPVYKLSATADRKPGPDGCYAVLPVTTGSICFDENISSSVFLVPTVVPGTAAAPKLGLSGGLYKSSDSTKIFPVDSPPMFVFRCGWTLRTQSDVVESRPETVDVQDSKPPNYQNLKNDPPKTAVVVGPEVKPIKDVKTPELLPPSVSVVVVKTPPLTDKKELQAEQQILVPESKPGSGDSTQTAAKPEVSWEVIVPPNGEPSGSSMTDPSNLSKLDDPSTPKSEKSDINPPSERQTDPPEEFPEDKEKQPLWAAPNWTISPNSPPPPTVKKAAPTGGASVEVEDQSEALLDKE